MNKEFNCDDFSQWLHPYLDNEIESELALHVHSHMAHCGACKAKFEQFQTLQKGLQQAMPYHAAPEILQQSIVSELTKPTAIFSFPKWLLPAVSSAALAASVMFFLAIPGADENLMDELVSNHVRSLMAQHLTDVASANTHTVKPWFTGKLDFSPPVYDFSEQGFPLLGGRLEYINHQSAAALSYKRNNHTINLFIRPTESRDTAVKNSVRRNYNILYWRKNALEYEAISDLSLEELQEFSKLYSEKL